MVQAKVSKVSPPLPREGEGALPGTNTSSTGPETSSPYITALLEYFREKSKVYQELVCAGMGHLPH